MISDNQYIHLVPNPIEKDECEVCSHCSIYYVDEKLGLNILFGYTETNNFDGSFGWKSIQPLLNNERFFNTDTRRDPGFELNQYFQGLLKYSDVVSKYHFVDNNPLGVRPTYSSWFYNDKTGNIVFEISPTYPFWGIKKKDRTLDFITYKDFMKDYKVVIHQIIPKETLIHWDNQTKSYSHVSHDFK
jgi:hypothetical protein